jgi:chaperonin GroEL
MKEEGASRTVRDQGGCRRASCGGGVALIRAARNQTGLARRRPADRVSIIILAIGEPLVDRHQRRPRRIVVVQKVREMKDTEDLTLADTCGDLVKAGVIDPVKVVRSALQNHRPSRRCAWRRALISHSRRKEAPAMPGGGGMGRIS